MNIPQQSKKKKQPKNAFYFFMVDYKRKQENRGVRFPGGMKEVAEKAAPAWKTLKPEDRWEYEEAARKEKERDKTDLENKFTTQGKSYAQIEREKAEYMEKNSRMLQEIQCTVSSLDPSTMTTYPFHVIHVNYYCRQECGDYTPCEIALAEFNFSEGVRKTYHTLINPGQIPLGYRFEADKLSKETHQIPVPPEEFGGETDYYKIFTNVKRFVMGLRDKDLYPYYTHPNSIDAVKNVLLKLQDDFSERVEFRVYPLTRLLYELKNACVAFQGRQGFPALSVAERELDKDVFNFAKGISCDFHEETDALPHCSLSCVRRWCFLIMDYCCMDLEIDLIPGQHCPRQADTSHYEKVVSRSSSSMGASSISKSNKSAVKMMTSPGTVNPGKKSEPLAPLRLPKSQPEALPMSGISNNYDNDFPAIGASRRGPFGSEPVAVAGRGMTWASNFTNPVTRGRGRPLMANLEEDRDLIKPITLGRGRARVENLEENLKNMNMN